VQLRGEGKVRTSARSGEPSAAIVAFPEATAPSPSVKLTAHPAVSEQSRLFALPSSLNCSGWKICLLTLVLELPAITKLSIEFWKEMG
jgi:hypothetical protein